MYAHVDADTSTPRQKASRSFSGLDEASPRLRGSLLLRFCARETIVPGWSFRQTRTLVQSASSDVSTSKKPVFLVAALVAAVDAANGENLVTDAHHRLAAPEPPCRSPRVNIV